MDEERTVVVTDENLNLASGVEGTAIIYTAIVQDNLGVAMPNSFVVDLEIDGTPLIAGQVFEGAVYGLVTKLLTLSWTVPAAIAGSVTVRLSWAEQTI